MNSKLLLQVLLLPLLVTVFVRLSYCAKPYQEEALRMHNLYRFRHQMPLMVMDEGLNEAAEKCAEWYVEIGTLNHKCPYKNTETFQGWVGENLVEGNWEPMLAAEKFSYTWYSEIKGYNYTTGCNKGKICGHFTQVVWKKSTALGMGVVKKKKGTPGYYGVGLYGPGGNVMGAYYYNVYPPVVENKDNPYHPDYDPSSDNAI